MNQILRLAVIVTLTMAAAASEWPQLQRTPERSGYTPDEPKPPYTLKWTVSFLPETIATAAQVVSDGRRAYIGTKSGVIHALALEDGAEAWRFQADGPIIASCAAAGGKVYAATLFGVVHAVNAETGAELWHFRPGDAFEERGGFSAAPLLAEGKLILANRRGLILAFEAETGKELWRAALGDRIFHTPAYGKIPEENFGRITVGAEDMHVYCLNASDGAVLWKSEKISGISFREYHPVIANGIVAVRSLYGGLRGGIHAQKMCPEPYTGLDPLIAEHATTVAAENNLPLGFDKERGGFKRSSPQMRGAALKPSAKDLELQKKIADWFKSNPFYRELYLLDLKSGRETAVPCVVFGYANNGIIPPPVAGPSGALYFTTQMLSALTHSKGGAGNPAKTARVNPATGLVEEWLPAMGYGEADSNENLSMGGDTLFMVGYQQGNFGALNVKTMTVNNGPVGGAFTYPYSENIFSGGNSLSVVGNMLLHNRFNHIVAVTGQ